MKIIDNWKAKRDLVNYLKRTGFEHRDLRCHGMGRETFQKKDTTVEIWKDEFSSLISAYHPSFKEKFKKGNKEHYYAIPNRESYKKVLELTKEIYPNDVAKKIPLNFKRLSLIIFQFLCIIAFIVCAYSLVIFGFVFFSKFYNNSSDHIKGLTFFSIIAIAGALPLFNGIERIWLRATLIFLWLSGVALFAYYRILN
jgi:hypothetical protein